MATVEEEKKAKKPRAVKKTGAGTKSVAEEKPKKKSAAAKKTEEVKEETPAVKQEEKAAEAPKKAPAKRTRKKAAEPAKTEEPVAAAEPATVEEPKAEEPKKRGRKKKSETSKAEEAKADEVKAEASAKVEEVKQEEKAPEKVAKKPAKKAEKTAKKPQKTVQKSAEILEEKAEELPTEKAVEKVAEKPALTKAEKRAFVKKLVGEALETECKWSELVDRVAQSYQEAYPIPENANLNDVKGRVGSVLHLMQEEGEILVEGNLVKRADKAQKTEKEPTVSATKMEKQPKKTAKKAEEAATQEKAEEKPQSVPAEKTVEEPAKQPEEKPAPTAIQKVEAPAPAPVYDLSALFDKKKPVKKTEEMAKEQSVSAVAKEKSDELAQTKAPEKTEKTDLPIKAKTDVEKVEKKPAPVKAEEKPAEKADKAEKQERQEKPQRKEVPIRRPMRAAKVDPLKDAFLKKLRSLGGNYFEYYAIYLLERYSRMNGRRLEGLRVSGGEYDGGIDGELELTDRLGFRETIYVQAKNWEPTDERWWIGETILQQFIGAVAYRQAKEGKQHCRGMFITTSAFTTGAKEMLDKMSDQFVGYDGDDLYETAKECQFGMLRDEKGNWKIDEELLSGKKSFFFML
ncbi:MAG: restriction endonuclease [Clostridia bacterium]|nr:restriction endonuclease [Clostridia bacterium]